MKLLILIALLLPLSSHAFNWNKCKQGRKGNHALNHLFFYSSSTSSYISSTGGCAMIGQTSHDKKVFVAQNYEDLKVDIARGQGQYIESYAALSGYGKDQFPAYFSNLKNNFEYIFGRDLNSSPEMVYNNIESLSVGENL